MELQNLRAFVEDPLSSKAAAAFQLTILVLIVASCSSVILQTLPQFQDLTLFWLEATVTIFFTIELLLRLLVNYTLNFENVEILNLVFCFCEALIIWMHFDLQQQHLRIYCGRVVGIVLQCLQSDWLHSSFARVLRARVFWAKSYCAHDAGPTTPADCVVYSLFTGLEDCSTYLSSMFTAIVRIHALSGF